LLLKHRPSTSRKREPDKGSADSDTPILDKRRDRRTGEGPQTLFAYLEAASVIRVRSPEAKRQKVRLAASEPAR